jgi:hypothetical protein
MLKHGLPGGRRRTNAMKAAHTGRSERPLKQYPAVGACGLDCGLCPRYYTAGPSRCPGCAAPGFFDKHPSCSFITCCVKKRQHEVCAECSDFPCAKFRSEEEYRQLKETPGFPPAWKIWPNLLLIRDQGIEKFMEQQNLRIHLLGAMIGRCDDGRSRSRFCRAAAAADPADLKKALEAVEVRIQAEGIGEDDRKSRANILRALLDGIAGDGPNSAGRSEP